MALCGNGDQMQSAATANLRIRSASRGATRGRGFACSHRGGHTCRRWSDLPFHHRDPLTADHLQAVKESMPICTGDTSFGSYGVPIICSLCYSARPAAPGRAHRGVRGRAAHAAPGGRDGPLAVPPSRTAAACPPGVLPTGGSCRSLMRWYRSRASSAPRTESQVQPLRRQTRRDPADILRRQRNVPNCRRPRPVRRRGPRARCRSAVPCRAPSGVAELEGDMRGSFSISGMFRNFRRSACERGPSRMIDEAAVVFEKNSGSGPAHERREVLPRTNRRPSRAGGYAVEGRSHALSRERRRIGTGLFS